MNDQNVKDARAVRRRIVGFTLIELLVVIAITNAWMTSGGECDCDE